MYVTLSMRAAAAQRRHKWEELSLPGSHFNRIYNVQYFPAKPSCTGLIGYCYSVRLWRAFHVMYCVYFLCSGHNDNAYLRLWLCTQIPTDLRIHEHKLGSTLRYITLGFPSLILVQRYLFFYLMFKQNKGARFLLNCFILWKIVHLIGLLFILTCLHGVTPGSSLSATSALLFYS